MEWSQLEEIYGTVLTLTNAQKIHKCLRRPSVDNVTIGWKHFPAPIQSGTSSLRQTTFYAHTWSGAKIFRTASNISGLPLLAAHSRMLLYPSRRRKPASSVTWAACTQQVRALSCNSKYRDNTLGAIINFFNINRDTLGKDNTKKKSGELGASFLPLQLFRVARMLCAGISVSGEGLKFGERE